jgi:hypothetical protein
MSSFFNRSGSSPTRKPVKRLYTTGPGGVPQIDHALDQQNQEEQKAREQAQHAAINDAAQQAYSSFFQRNTRRFTKAGFEKYTAIRPKEKCWHGVLVWQHYCEVCYWEKIDLTYNPKLYATAITKGVGNARRSLRGPEGDKDYADVKMLVDIEVWKASKNYGSEMNDALAYTVARRTAQKYLAERIEEQTVFVGLDLQFATLKDCEDAERLLLQCDGADVLDQLANDKDADPEDRKTAQRLINEYGERKPRFAALDGGSPFADGKGVSAAEYEVDEEGVRDENRAPDVAETFEDSRPALVALVATWRGDKKKVGEAMLKPDFSVRNVPGLDKSKVSRLYQVVVREFKTLISKAFTK